MRRASTISDVARRADVSKTTVSLVMRDKPGISPETRERVLRASRDLHYRPALTRQTRGRLHSGQIGFMVTSEVPLQLGSEMGGGYLHHMLQGAMATAAEHGESLAVCHMTTEQIRAGKLPTAVANDHVDGLLIRCQKGTHELLELLNARDIPYVLMDSEQIVEDAVQVQIDNVHGMRLLTHHLVRQGCRRFAVITGDLEHLNGQERLAGLQAALAAEDIYLQESHVIREHGFTEPSGERGARELLRRTRDFDALICHSDLIAAGALRVMQQDGIDIPATACLAGFDNMSFCKHLAVSLASVDSRPWAVGEAAANLLVRLVKSGERQPLQVRVPPRLEVRESALRMDQTLT